MDCTRIFWLCLAKRNENGGDDRKEKRLLPIRGACDDDDDACDGDDDGCDTESSSSRGVLTSIDDDGDCHDGGGYEQWSNTGSGSLDDDGFPDGI